VTILSRPWPLLRFPKITVRGASRVRNQALLLPEAGPYFEFRALFVVRKADVVLVTVGNHDDIVRFVRENPKS